MLPVNKKSELLQIIKEAKRAGKDTKELERLVKSGNFKTNHKLSDKHMLTTKKYKYVSTGGPIREKDFR
jgi:2-polyprenyl-3-methyl-5-hydroxy-6-metoxy-1,4-benzoquinol methylase